MKKYDINRVLEGIRSPALPEEMIKKSSEDGFMTSPRIPEIVDCCNQIIRYLKAREDR